MPYTIFARAGSLHAPDPGDNGERSKTLIRKRHSAHGKMIITFEIPGTIWAESVNLVGDFNNWDRVSLPFRRGRDGNWRVEVEG